MHQPACDHLVSSGQALDLANTSRQHMCGAEDAHSSWVRISASPEPSAHRPLLAGAARPRARPGGTKGHGDRRPAAYDTASRANGHSSDATGHQAMPRSSRFRGRAGLTSLPNHQPREPAQQHRTRTAIQAPRNKVNKPCRPASPALQDMPRPWPRSGVIQGAMILAPITRGALASLKPRLADSGWKPS